jgi:hypothetical protein
MRIEWLEFTLNNTYFFFMSILVYLIRIVLTLLMGFITIFVISLILYGLFKFWLKVVQELKKFLKN